MQKKLNFMTIYQQSRKLFIEESRGQTIQFEVLEYMPYSHQVQSIKILEHFTHPNVYISNKFGVNLL